MGSRAEKKVVLVTGGANGIGQAIAITLASEGALVVIADLDAEAGNTTIRAISEQCGAKAMFVEADLSVVAECKRVVQEVVNHHGRIDGLVNNLGIYPWAALSQTDEELFDTVFSINFKSAFFCSKYAVEQMVSAGGGSIVQIGSTHGFAGFKDLAAYACSKGSMHTLSRHIAKNYAEYKIRSNWITVGWVLTDKERARIEESADDAELEIQKANESIPLGRLQTPEDIAQSVLFLISDESSQVTATDIHVAGGFNL